MVWTETLTTHDLIWLGVFIGFGLGICSMALINEWKKTKKNVSSEEQE